MEGHGHEDDEAGKEGAKTEADREWEIGDQVDLEPGLINQVDHEQGELLGAWVAALHGDELISCLV